ncbi:MAG: DegV family protein [Proteocatella sp.]
MKKIRIVVDQALDMPDDIINKYGIKVVNLNVTFGDEVAGNYTNREFYEKMRNSPVLPKTSCPSPDAFLEEYKNGDDDIIVITLSEELSATYGSAVLARDMYMSENASKSVTVIDSTNGSIGSALLVVKIANMIEAGSGIDEIVENSKEMIKHMIHYGTLETIENAVKGGRISKTKGFVANVLNLKPIVQIDRTVFVVDKGRGTKSSLKKMLELVENDIVKYDKKVSILGIAHSNDREKAELVKTMMLDKHEFEEVIVAEIGPIIGTYTAEGAVLVSVI